NKIFCSIKPVFSEKYKAFYNDGKYFSNESKGFLSFKMSMGFFIKEIIFKYDFLRINSPFSSNYALYIRNIDNNIDNNANNILNNSNGNPINAVYPIYVNADNGFVFIDNNKKDIVFNLANGIGKYGDFSSLPKKHEDDNYFYDYIGSSVDLKKNKAFEDFDFSKKQHYSSILRFINGKFSKNIKKSYFRVSFNKNQDNTLTLLKYLNKIPDNLPEDYFKNYQKTQSDRIIADYSNNIIPNKIILDNEFERLDFSTYSDLQDNSFFLNRITLRTSNFNQFYNRETNALSLKNNIVFIDNPYIYLPYIDIVKDNGVIICSGDIFIDTLKNPLKKSLTIVSTNGKIIIGNEVGASIIALSPNGKLQGVTNSRKKIEGSVIVDSIDFDSLKKGADIYYNQKYQTPVYNMTISNYPVFIF
ncbi:MAG: hypothetical protein M0Q02_11825, partial [Candidatus Muirbacterium halophilum]|nr:hypothetical protein [Candidatus Muirbacterium halophilum]